MSTILDPGRLQGLLPRTAGLVLAALGIVLWHQGGNNYGPGFWMWALGLAVYVASFPGRQRSFGALGIGTMWGLVAILVGAVALRLPDIYDNPANISIDELLPMLEAYRITLGEAPNVFASIGWFSLPNLTFTPAALVMAGTRLEPFYAVRLASLLTGLVGIGATFLLARRMFSERTALLAALLLCLGFWHIHNSRAGFPFAQSSCLPPLALHLLVSALQDRNQRRLALAGVVAGLALQFYFPVRILLPLLPLFCLGYLRHQRYSADEAASAIVILLVPFGLTVLPNLWFTGWSALAGHSQDILITRPGIFDELTRRYALYDWSSLLQRNLTEAWRMLTQWADVAVLNRSASGLFDDVTLVLVIAGICIALLEGSVAALLAVFWAAFTFLAGVVLTDSPRASYRLAAALPAFVMLAGFGLDRILTSVAQRPSWYGRTMRPLLLLAVAVWIGRENHQMFFHGYARGDGKEMPWSAAMRYLARNCDGRQFYLFSGTEQLARNDALPLFCPDYQTVDLVHLTTTVDKSRPATFVVMGQQFSTLAALSRCYPSAKISAHRKPDGGTFFNSVEVPISDLVKADPNCATPPVPKPPRQPA